VGSFIGVGCQRQDFAGKLHLSFDDGASEAVTTALLTTLAHYHVAASFFEVGSHLAQLPDHGRALLAAKQAGGHVIGNHSFTHAPFPRLSREQIAWELQATQTLLADFTSFHLIRPPFGDDNARVRAIFQELGYVEVTWDVQSSDPSWEAAYERGEPGIRERYIQHVVAQASKKHGGILLLHDTERITTDNLPAILDTLQQHGFNFVPLTYFLELEKRKSRAVRGVAPPARGGMIPAPQEAGGGEVRENKEGTPSDSSRLPCTDKDKKEERHETENL
jgi:peptidoglycan/xylan/chitin deacetylase (PgdA/CDA1 family)